MGIGKRKPYTNRTKNTANSDMKGRRLYIKNATVNAVKRVLGRLALKVRVSGTPGVVEVVHSDNRGRVWRLLIDAGYKTGLSGMKFPVLPSRRNYPTICWD